MSKARKPNRRDEWRREQDCCHNPECLARYSRGDSMETHEIIGGSDRAKTVTMPAFFLFLCHADHNTLGSRPNQESLVKQLSWKKWSDPDNYNPAAVIRMWRPNCTPAFEVELIDAIAEEYQIIVRNFA